MLNCPTCQKPTELKLLGVLDKSLKLLDYRSYWACPDGHAVPNYGPAGFDPLANKVVKVQQAAPEPWEPKPKEPSEYRSGRGHRRSKR